MKTYSELRKERQQKNLVSESKKLRYERLKESLLNSYYVEHESELSEGKFLDFQKKLTNQWNLLKDRNKTFYDLNESEIKSDDEFRDYAENLLKKAHKDNYDEEIANDVIDGLISKYEGDYGAMVGALTSSLGK